MPAHALPFLHLKPSLPSHTHASTPIVAIPCTYFHAHRGPPISTLAFTRFHAHLCPPIHTLARTSRSLHKLVSTRIAALAYTASTAIAPFQYTHFHVNCCHPIHLLSITAPTRSGFHANHSTLKHSLRLPLRPSHTLTSKPTALAFMPIAVLPYTHFIAHCGPADNRLFTFNDLRTCSLCTCPRKRLRTSDHAVVPGGGRGGERNDEDGAARLGRGGPARTGRPGSDRGGPARTGRPGSDRGGPARTGRPGSDGAARLGRGYSLLQCWLACEAGSKPRCCFIGALTAQQPAC